MKKLTKIFALILVATIVATIIGVNTPVSAANATKVVTVTTEKALMKEIAKKSAATIILETSKSTTITMKSKVAKTIKRAKNKKVIIDAPNAKVRNYLKFKTLTIKNAKAVSERVNGNKITVQSATTKFSVYKNITVKKLTIPAYTQVTLGKKAKITTVKYTKTKPAKVTATPTEKPVVTTVPTTIPAPTETPTPVVVPTQTPVVTEVPTQAPTITEAPTTEPTTTVEPTITDTPAPTKPEKPGDNYYWDEERGEWISFTNTSPYWWGPNGHAYMVYWDNGQYNNGKANFKAMTDYGTGEVTISESEIVYPANWTKPEGWGVPYNSTVTPEPTTTPTVTESASATPEVTITTTVSVTPEPTQEVEITTTPEPTITATVTPEPTVTAEPVPTEHEHQFTCTHFKNFKVKELHKAEYTTVDTLECSNPNCRCKFYTIIDNEDGTQSITYWTRDEINEHGTNHYNNGEYYSCTQGHTSIISKAAYYTEEIRNLCVCDICGTVQSYGDQYIIICEVD